MDPTYDLPKLLSDWSDVEAGGQQRDGFVERSEVFRDESGNGVPVASLEPFWNTAYSAGIGEKVRWDGGVWEIATAESRDGMFRYHLIRSQ